MRSGRDILSGFGPESPANQKPRATSGGNPPTRDVMGYSPPTGPIGIMRGNAVGLGGTNHGNGQRPNASRPGGSPGVGGTNCGNKGSQGC